MLSVQYIPSSSQTANFSLRFSLIAETAPLPSITAAPSIQTNAAAVRISKKSLLSYVSCCKLCISILIAVRASSGARLKTLTLLDGKDGTVSLTAISSHSHIKALRGAPSLRKIYFISKIITAATMAAVFILTIIENT